MNENILELLMFMLETGIMEDREPDEEALAATLTEAGFGNSEIKRAFLWLETTHRTLDTPATERLRSSGGFRIYTDDEIRALGQDGINFLQYLENLDILDSVTRELIIERFLALDTAHADLNDIKWVALFVLMNLGDRSFSNNEILEGIIFGEEGSPVH